MSITFPDRFRPHINITVSGHVWQQPDGKWSAIMDVDNPGYGTSLPASGPFDSRVLAEDWVRDQASKYVANMQIGTEFYPVDLSDIAVPTA